MINLNNIYISLNDKLKDSNYYTYIEKYVIFITFYIKQKYLKT